MFQHTDDVPRHLEPDGGAQPAPTRVEAHALSAVGRHIRVATAAAAGGVLELMRARRRRRRFMRELDRLNDYQRVDLGVARLEATQPATEQRSASATRGADAAGNDFIAAVISAAGAETPPAARTRHIDPGARRRHVHHVHTRRQP